jgi:hypothetical protein
MSRIEISALVPTRHGSQRRLRKSNEPDGADPPQAPDGVASSDTD